jgi:hypothetical protein
MRGGVAYRVGLIVLVLLLTGVAIFVVRPREFLLTYCAVGPFVASLLGMAWFRRPALRNSFLVLASVSLVSGLLDPITYFTNRPVVQAEGTWNNQYHYLWDANLGIALPPNVAARAYKFTDHALVYDVTYTTDANGHRKTMGSTDASADNVIFMGCSFTFGEGVQDSETLPQQFSDQAGRKYNVVNFGVSTFGVHQPLRSMELGQLTPILTGGKRYIVYTGIPGHAQRAAAIGLRGPSYGLQADGSVKYLGQTQSFWQVFAVEPSSSSRWSQAPRPMPCPSMSRWSSARAKWREKNTRPSSSSSSGTIREARTRRTSWPHSTRQKFPTSRYRRYSPIFSTTITNTACHAWTRIPTRLPTI